MAEGMIMRRGGRATKSAAFVVTADQITPTSMTITGIGFKPSLIVITFYGNFTVTIGTAPTPIMSVVYDAKSDTTCLQNIVGYGAHSESAITYTWDGVAIDFDITDDGFTASVLLASTVRFADNGNCYRVLCVG